MINIVLFGPPGSGKGTQAENLAKKFNLKSISTGDLFRFNIKNGTTLGNLAKTYIDDGLLVPDEVTMAMVKDELSKPTSSNGFILDGVTRTTNQAVIMDRMLEELFNDKVTITLSLKVDDEILVERLLNRGKDSGRTDDANETVIRSRIKEYYDKTAEVADYYKKQGKLAEIDGVGAINEISEKLFAAVERFTN